MGVTGEDDELERLFESIGHYPLLIRALAGEVAGYRPAPGDLYAWLRAHPGFDPFALPMIQAKSHVLGYALDDLGEDDGELLQTIATFRAPVDYPTVEALFVQRRSWSTQHLDTVLSNLEDRGLLGWDRATNRYDLHPVVRGVVWSGLDDVRRRALYGQLEQHFSSGPADDAAVATTADALRVIELMRALIGLGRYAEAAKLYFDRLHRSSTFSFTGEGLGHVNIALLEGLFPDGLDDAPAVAPDNYSGVISQLGHAYEAAGRLTEAHRCAVSLLEESPHHKPQHYNYRYAAPRDLQLGRLRTALEHSRLALSRSLESAVGKEDDYAADQLALCEATVGDYDGALKRLAGLTPEQFYDPHASELRVRLWLGQYGRALELGPRALLYLEPYHYHRQEVVLDLAECDVHLGRLDAAVDTMLDVLREARAKGWVELELQALRPLADACRLRGDLATARALLDDLDEIAARGPYRLIQADAANIRALLTDTDVAARRAAAEQAFRLAWCDGPPYAYHRGLERATRTLRELGAPLPQPEQPPG
jgi:tetratricopeptide (TPR) repeat protein